MTQGDRSYLHYNWLTIHEAAQLLGISESAAQQRARRERWEYVRKGRGHLYFRRDIENLKKESGSA